MKKLLIVLIVFSVFACGKNKQAKGGQPSNPTQAAQLNLKDANQLLGQKQCNKAIPLYKKFLEKEPRDSAGWNLLGLAYLCNNEPQQAVTAFNRALEISPTFTDVHNNLGVAYTEMRDYPQARNEFLKALQDVNYPPAGPWFNLAKLAFMQQNYEESRALAKKVMERNPKAPGPQLLYAISLDHLGRTNEAAESYRSVLKTAPDNMEASYYLANLLVRAHQDCEAREYYRKVIDSDPIGELGQKAIAALKSVQCQN